MVECTRINHPITVMASDIDMTIIIEHNHIIIGCHNCYCLFIFSFALLLPFFSTSYHFKILHLLGVKLANVKISISKYKFECSGEYIRILRDWMIYFL